MYCSKCGNQLDNEAEVCSSCGNKMTVATEEAPVVITVKNKTGISLASVIVLVVLAYVFLTSDFLVDDSDVLSIAVCNEAAEACVGANTNGDFAFIPLSDVRFLPYDEQIAILELMFAHKIAASN